MGEEVSTYSALVEESYTPTTSKPYQGIWVGDYSAHGCEFLLVMQSEHSVDVDTSRRSSTASGLPSGLAITKKDPSDAAADTTDEACDQTEHHEEDAVDDQPQQEASSVPLEEIPSGRIEAIKLTGDLNVPRGECTWFADDISDAGLVRVAEEEQFRGARIVKSMGQVATEHFKHNRYIDSQLILISHDTIAQYWQVSSITSPVVSILQIWS